MAKKLRSFAGIRLNSETLRPPEEGNEGSGVEILQLRKQRKREDEKMGLKIERRVERVNGKDLSYTQFVEQYLVQNQPVILTGLMEDWRACKDWILEDGKPNLQFFSTHFGNSKVQVFYLF